MSSKVLSQLALLKTKAIVNAYTWTTLPFYAIAHRPWLRTKRCENNRVQTRVRRSDGKLIYSRPMVPLDPRKFPVMQHSTIPEVLDSLEPHHDVIGVRDVHDEFVARDSTGSEIKIEGKTLRKMVLADEFRYLKMGHALEHVNSFAKGLAGKLGVKRGDHVLIYADNSVEWFYSALAILKANGVLVTLFSTLGDSGIIHGMNQSDARFVITSEDLLPRLARLSPSLTHLQNIIYIPGRSGGNVTSGSENEQSIATLRSRGLTVHSYNDIESSGEKQYPDLTFPAPSPSETAVIMYTSGTTGEPKGVLISHGQLISGIKTIMNIDEEINNLAFGKQYAAFLPLSHLFGFLINIAGFCSHSKMAFCSPMTLLDSSPAHVEGQMGDLKLIQPEFFIAVPLLCERIISEIYRKLAAKAPGMIPIFTYLMDYKIRWTARGYETPILDRLVCNKIAQQFGGKLKLIAVSSAPLNVRTHALVQAALNIKVVNAYGATETCGGTHMSLVDDLKLGNCGVPFTEFYLEDWSDGGYHVTDKPNARGEIVVGGPSISSGYYKLDDETKKAFYTDENGINWYRTGDIGEMLPNGTLKLIDRKKDLIKLANGEFISLGKIESALRNSQFVENVAVCTHPYSSHLVALVSPNRKALTDAGQRIGLAGKSFEELCDSEVITEHVFASIKKHCKENAFKIREVPVSISLVKEEWTPGNAMLTAAFKLKRKSVYNFYEGLIGQMFEDLQNDTKGVVSEPKVSSIPEANQPVTNV